MKASGIAASALLTVSLGEAASPRPYPQVDSYLQTTNFLNHTSYFHGLGDSDHQWYLDNIPFIDIPDSSIQEIYY